jgi:multidrug efflux pump subunit AcrA (membrane-fusion protein)
MPGTYVVANFAPPAGLTGLFIPGESIVVRNGQNMVATVVDNRVHFKTIQLGRDYGDQTEVLSGLQAGDVVVRNVSDDIEENAEIEPRYRTEKADSPKRP